MLGSGSMRSTIAAVRGGRIKHAALRVLMIFAVFGLPVLSSAPAFAHDTVYYYYTTPLHNVAVETDAHGNVIERTYYAPYGQILNRPLHNGPGYTGHEEDPATGLVYMQQRYYDPQAGRFISTDPVQAAASGGNFNRYGYAKDNPYRYTDPDGRCPDAGGGCSAMVAAYAASPEAQTSTSGLSSPQVAVAIGALAVASGMAEEAVGASVLRAAERYVAGKTASAVTRRAADSTESAAKGGRAANKLRPHPDAAGAHTTFKQGVDGKVSNYATYSENPQNPSGFQVAKRVDVAGKAHTNPDGKVVSTPHVKEGSSRYVRPARKDEIPGG